MCIAYIEINKRNKQDGSPAKKTSKLAKLILSPPGSELHPTAAFLQNLTSVTNIDSGYMECKVGLLLFDDSKLQDERGCGWKVSYIHIE
jgi:hypothetical protein